MQAVLFNPRPFHWVTCKAVGALWPGVYRSRLSSLRLANIPTPALPGPDWVRVRTILGGICGTDLGLIYLRQHPASILRSFVRFPAGLGHENVAVIDELGPEAERAGWRPGQRVCVESMLSCAVRDLDPPCESCREGRFSLCQRLTDGALPPAMMLGLNDFTGGSWGQYFVAHRTQLHAVPDTIDDETAVLTDPLACALHAALRRPPSDSESVLVLGGGIQGLGLLAAIRALGSRAQRTAVVRHAYQADLAKRFGAKHVVRWARRHKTAQRYAPLAEITNGRCVAGVFGNQALMGGFDVVYDCIGNGRSLTDAMKLAKPGGTVVEVGTPTIALVEHTPLWMSELTVLGCYGRQIETYQGRRMHTYRLVFELIESGKLDVAGLLTHTFALTDYRKALAAIAHRGRHNLVKAALAPPGA